MMMINKCKRLGVGAGSTDDVISGLPRHLIDNILKCLPIRDAARTSILSRRWRYIWSEHPCLLLDKHFFEENMKNRPLCVYAFVITVNKILLLHNGPIFRCTLYIADIQHDRTLHVDQWLLFLSRNGIKELSLDNHYLNPYKLPSYILSSPELARLKLYNCTFKPPDTFGNLISLQFAEMAFSANILGPLVLDAPQLERLNFTRCIGIQHFKIHAPKLKAFNSIESVDATSISFGGTPSMSKLFATLEKKAENLGQGRKINLNNFLNQMTGLSHLCFDGFFLELLAVGHVPQRLSVTFNFLKRLMLDELKFDNLTQMQCLLCLLRSSPKLRELDIEAVRILGNIEEPDLSVLESPGHMIDLLSGLQTVKLSCITGLKAELLFIRWILSQSPLLERMYVYYNETVDALLIETELMRFRRASPRAELIYMKSEVFYLQKLDATIVIGDNNPRKRD